MYTLKVHPWCEQHHPALGNTASLHSFLLPPPGASGNRAVVPQVSTAKEAVETGLEIFEGGQTEAALVLFQKALTLKPNEDEARAALYNAACCHTKLKQWQPAVECAMKAINEYDLKLVVALRVGDVVNGGG